MDDLLQEFLTETGESLAALDNDLVSLEKNPDDAALIARIFRLVHTVKGNCGFLGLTRLENVAHHAENVLVKYRDGALRPAPETVSLILETLDCIRTITDGLATTGKEPAGDDGFLIVRLDAAASATQPDAHTEAAATMGAAEEIAARTLRVNVDTLEDLMTMVGELVLTRNQLLRRLSDRRDVTEQEEDLPLQRLDQAVSGLQEGVMRARMQPVGNVWGKLPRLVRDLALELRKKIRLEMDGAETALDRQMLEWIRDPLTHMIRNAADHAIELPADRVRAGKPPEGVIRLSAHQEGAYVVITLSDDGRGLDAAKIAQSALKRGLVDAQHLQAMTEKDIRRLIFSPGFSTAEQVTEISGRGVGMEVVRDSLEKVGGDIGLTSTTGKGTSFTLRIPLTLAIIPALILRAGTQTYAVPQNAVHEAVRLSAGGEYRMENTAGAPVLRLRDQLLPLAGLSGLLAGKPVHTTPQQEQMAVVISAVANRAGYGLMIDAIEGTEEIVVKPLSPVLRHLPVYGGNAVLGDGRTVLILDPAGLARMIGIENERNEKEKETKEDIVIEPMEQLLVFRSGSGAPCAVQLSCVMRLEKFSAAEISPAGKGVAVSYRGKVMPLVPFASTRLPEAGKSQTVIVLGREPRLTGLMVDDIVDIIEAPAAAVSALQAVEGEGILGSTVIAGKVMDILDAQKFMQAGGAAP